MARMSTDTHPCKELFGVFYSLNTHSLSPSHSLSSTFVFSPFAEDSRRNLAIVRAEVNVELWSY